MANYAVNFEILSNEIRIVEASRNRDQITLQSCARLPIDLSQKTKIGDVIRRALSSKSPSDKIVATAVWSPKVIVRRIQMPVMSQVELKSAIRYEFEKHIPFPINDCLLDHYIVRKLGANERMEVMLVSSKRDLVENKRKFLADAGWDLHYIDIHPFALANAFHLKHPKKTNVYALIHIGEVTNQKLKAPNFVIIVKDNQPVIVRDLGDEIACPEGKLGDDELDHMANAIQKSFQFYENSADEIIEEIYLSGQGAHVSMLETRLQDGSEMKLNKWGLADNLNFANPACRKEYVANEHAYLVAAGLSARSLMA